MTTITIKHIADQLNLSVSTVSKALRDYPDISSKTKKKVLALAKELNYQPNILAQNLRSKSSKSIGVIVPDIVYFFFNDAISGISEIMEERGYTLMLSQSNESSEREAMITRALVSNRIAGLLVSISKSSPDIDHLKVVQLKQIPIVLFDRTHESIAVNKIVSDDYEGAYKAVEYLIRSGCRRIAHITGPIYLDITQHRLDGYRNALRKYGLPVNTDLIFEGNFQVSDGRRAMRAFLAMDNPPDAVFAANDEEAYGVYEVSKENGLRIPDDLSVIGFSNDPISNYMEPALTTVAQPAFEIGKAAAKLLIQEIEASRHGTAVEHRTTYFQTRLIIRGSTRPLTHTA